MLRPRSYCRCNVVAAAAAEVDAATVAAVLVDAAAAVDVAATAGAESLGLEATFTPPHRSS